MEIFWNNGERENIQGLDILALRQLDQRIEQDWVANVTTISIRARYLSLLPWLFAEYYSSNLQTAVGQATFDYEDFRKAAARMELVVLAATKFGGRWGESGVTYGAIGPDLYSDELNALAQDGNVLLDTASKGGAVYGTYVMPCRGFGLLNTATTNSAVPVIVQPRGQKLHQARKEAMSSDGLTQLILKGGILDVDLLHKEGPYFSLNGLGSIPKELDLLRDALIVPYINHLDIEETYERFTESATWFLTALKDVSNDMNSDDVLKRNYRFLVEATNPPSRVDLGWGEYELRRRVHFALELLLCALTHTLMNLVEGTVEDVLEDWGAHWQMPSLFEGVLSFSDCPLNLQLSDVTEQVQKHLFLKGGPNWSARDLSPGPQAVYALAILLACQEQTADLRSSGKLPERNHYMERAFRILADRNRTTHDAMRELLIGTVIEPHLQTSLRKLGQGQKCSLRFYPEGNALRATGTRVAAGYSGDRLGNVMGFFADVGFLDRVGSSRFAISADGRSLLKSWGGVA